MTTKQQTCLRCGSERVAYGRIVSSGKLIDYSASFKPHGLKSKLFMWVFPIKMRLEGQLCLDCGLVWSKVDPLKARAHIKKFGNDSLKSRLNLESKEESSR